MTESSKVISLPSNPKLSPAHLEHLRTSGLSDETLRLAHVHSEADPKRIAEHLGWKRWPKARGAGIVFPFYRPGTAEPYACRVRPDRPRRNHEGKPVKYEQPKREHLGYGVIPYLPPRTRENRLGDTTAPLYWTEGEKKALLLDQLGYATVGGCGVSCFHDVEHRDAEGEYRLHEWLREHVAVAGRSHRIVFDSDAATNDQVMRAARVLAGMLERAGASSVRFLRLPDADSGAKQGIDDLFFASGEPRAREVLDGDGETIEALDPSDALIPVHAMRGLGKAPVPRALRFPDFYRVDRTGLWRWSPGKQPMQVTTRPVLLGRILLDLYSGEERVEVVFQREGRWRTVLVDRVDLRSKHRLVSALAPLGVDVDTGTAAEMVAFLSAFEAVNEKRLPRTEVVDRCGWHTVASGTRTFCAPDPVRGDDLVFDDRFGRGKAVQGLRAEGELEAHLDVLRDSAAAEPIAAAAIFSALAAPLLEPLASSGFAVHLVGDSSRGKSSMLQIAASVFGDPTDETWVPTWDTTAVGLEVRAGILCDLPFCIDEAGVTDADTRARAVYALINGTGRTRGRREGGLRETAQWRTVVLSTGETELVRRSAGATGSRVRVLPLRVRGFGELGAAGVDDLRGRARRHFGHVGRAWLEMVVDEGDWSGARDAYREIVSDFRQRAGGQGLAARQAACWALLKLVEVKAHMEWGLGRAGGATIDDLFDGVSSGARDEDVRPVSEVALDLVRDLVMSKPDAFPRLKTSASGGLVTPSSGQHVRDRMGWIAPDGSVWCIPTALREYLEKHQLDEGVLGEWRDQGWIEAERGRWNIRKRLDGGRARVVAFNPEVFDVGPDPVVDT